MPAKPVNLWTLSIKQPVAKRDTVSAGTVTPPASLARRLAAMVYDILLLFAVLFFATLMVLPLNQGAAIAPKHPLYSSYLVFVSFLFYGWFWTHGGQTLGMRAWKLRLRTLDGRPVAWTHALLRFTAAIPSWALAGAGYLWILVDENHLAWHDRLSKTMIISERAVTGGR